MQPWYESHRRYWPNEAWQTRADRLHGLAAWVVRGTGHIPDFQLFYGRSQRVYHTRMHSIPGNTRGSIVRGFLDDTRPFARRLFRAGSILAREANDAVWQRGRRTRA